MLSKSHRLGSLPPPSQRRQSLGKSLGKSFGKSFGKSLGKSVSTPLPRPLSPLPPKRDDAAEGWNWIFLGYFLDMWVDIRSSLPPPSPLAATRNHSQPTGPLATTRTSPSLPPPSLMGRRRVYTAMQEWFYRCKNRNFRFRFPTDRITGRDFLLEPCRKAKAMEEKGGIGRGIGGEECFYGWKHSFL